jgi:hypothetical protein
MILSARAIAFEDVRSAIALPPNGAFIPRYRVLKSARGFQFIPQVRPKGVYLASVQRFPQAYRDTRVCDSASGKRALKASVWIDADGATHP